ncbi:MAG: hypothetical protein KTR23_04620 [Rhodospirillales bacterium]|nr:hypothetical protein [Rhodospirillales bacterium]
MNTEGREVSLEDVRFPNRLQIYATLYAGEDEDIKSLYQIANAITENVVFNEGSGDAYSFFYFNTQHEIEVAIELFKTSSNYDLRKYSRDGSLERNGGCFIRVVVDLTDTVVSYNAFSFGGGRDGLRTCLKKYDSVVHGLAY